MTEAERARALESAGYNVLNLDTADVEIDLFTDVPPRSYVAEVQAARTRALAEGGRHPDVAGLASRLYGDFRWIVSTKGRTVERTLVHALGLPPAPTVIAHGLFSTTQAALASVGAKLELAPRRPGGETTADIDAAWLETRLAAGGVDLVYLEAATNALGGLPATVEGMAAVSKVCRAHGVRLVLDCPRLLANAFALGGPLADTARALTAGADAITISCSKELLVPLGALLGVRDEALQRKSYVHSFEQGALLEPLDAVVALAAGMEVMLARGAEILGERRRLLELLANELSARGVGYRTPVGVHAVFVPLDPALLPDGGPSARALEGLLYRLAGVRGLMFPYPHLGGTVLRLPVPIARYGADAYHRVAEGVAATFARAAEAPRLAADPAPALHPGLTRYRPR